MQVTGNQFHAARILLGLDQDEIARRAHIGQSEVAAVEAARERAPRNLDAARDALTKMLKEEGVVFSDAEGPGVHLRQAAARQEGLRPCELDATNDD